MTSALLFVLATIILFCAVVFGYYAYDPLTHGVTIGLYVLAVLLFSIVAYRVTYR